MSSRRDQRAYSDAIRRPRRSPVMTGLAAAFGVIIIVTFALGQTVTSVPTVSASPAQFATMDSGTAALIAARGVIFTPLSSAQEAALGPKPSLTAIAQKAQKDMGLSYGPSAIYLGLAASAPGVSPEVSPGASPGVSPGASPGVSPGVSPGASPGASPGVSPGASPGAGGELAPTPAYAVVFVSAKSDIRVGSQSYQRAYLFLNAKTGDPLVEVGLN